MLGRLTDGTVQNCYHPLEFIRLNGEGRHESHDIPERTQQQTSESAGLGHAMPDATFQWKGGFRVTILHQFDANHKTALPDVPDMSQFGHGTQETGEQARFLPHLREGLFTRENLKIGQGDGAT